VSERTVDPLPANIDAEKAILGAILLDNSAHSDAEKAGIAPADFALDSHCIIWKRMAKMLGSGHAVDLVTLSAEMTRRKEIATIGGVEYLASLTEGLPHHPAIGEYAAILKGHSTSRALLRITDFIAARIEARVDTSANIAAQAAKDLAALAHGAVSDAVLKPDLIRLSDVAPQSVDWLWEPFIPLGMLSMLSGDPGVGKSTVALNIAAEGSRGRMRDGRICEAFNTLFLTIENPIAQVMRPRFDALGGDPTRLVVLNGTKAGDNGEERKGSVTLSDVHVLDDAIRETDARLIVIDPIQSYFGSGVDLHRSNETRPVLDGLSKLAELHGCAVLLLRHLSKQNGGKAITRGLGSIDLTAAVRSEMMVGSLPDDPDSRAMVHIKALTRMGKTQGFSIGEDGTFAWTGESPISASDLLAAPEPEVRGAKQEAEEWLQSVLSAGSKSVDELTKLAEVAGIKPRTLKRAKEALHVESHKPAFGAGWNWALPPNRAGNGGAEDMSEIARSLIHRVRQSGGRLSIAGSDILFTPGDPTTADALTDDLRTHKAAILALLQPRADDPETWRAPFVEWLDSACVLFERASCGLAVLHRLCCDCARARGEAPCTKDVFRAMLAELFFPLREVGGTELVDGLILKDDLQAIMAELESHLKRSADDASNTTNNGMPEVRTHPENHDLAVESACPAAGAVPALSGRAEIDRSLGVSLHGGER
jgi:hypothetical protein